jgi:PhoPQ-activated pathogenicity-related protein
VKIVTQIIRTLLFVLALTFWWITGFARADLEKYVTKPDSSFRWVQEKKESVATGVIYTLQMTSQTWQGIVWKHRLLIYVPVHVTPGETMTILNTGGGPGAAADLFAMNLAIKAQSPLAVLYDVPNQPLLGDKVEDALIAETFIRYLKTGDDEWPLLLPMVKSVVRSMDALQEFSKQEWKRSIKDFVITGASKRGWTSWLTAASGDKRVKAIAPMVIDTLNMPAQMRHQEESYGTLSEQIQDYSRNGLTDAFKSDIGKKLLALVDPYAYRKRLQVPKLILNGANDQYWTADSLRLYWDDLQGEKWVTYVPNAGHNLQEKGREGFAALARPVNILAAFIRSQTGGEPLPTLKWQETSGATANYRLTVTSTVAPRITRLWTALSATRDFRPSEWKAVDTGGAGTQRAFEAQPPHTGYAAVFAEMEFGEGSTAYTLCTPIRVLAAKDAPLATKTR